MSGSVPPTQRLISLDALRGFDMFWIVGGSALHGAVKTIGENPIGRLMSEQLRHVEWEGFHFYDLVFPMFVFIAGVSLAFSLPRSVERVGRSKTAWRLARRALVLFLIGVIYSGGLSKGLDQVRWLGVLQRIALASLGAGLLSIWLRGRWLAAICGGLLAAYWALLAWVPVPGGMPGDFREGHNIVNWFDAQFLPGRKYNGDHDPEGILSTFPAIANCLLGLLAGIFLRESRAGGSTRSAWLLTGGAALVALGMLWSLPFPIIKKLWTSSFVLVACGWSAILLGVFHQIIEVWNRRKWAEPFTWIGLNPITIYLAANFADFSRLAQRITGPTPGVLHAIVATGLAVLLAWWLHRKRIYLRV
ncbi:MAG: heparan-alpha-glucosaminide N-acetyltransferase domain-containing protein [Chthoniobacteraceae bacterium]